MKKQKVRFHRNDKRPSHLGSQLSYEKKMIKSNNKIMWQAREAYRYNYYSIIL